MSGCQERRAARFGILSKYAYAWITLAFFVISFAPHWFFGWKAYSDDPIEHGMRAEVTGYLVEMGRDTFENWQSEFLQLVWQVIGLACFLNLGFPSLKENKDRLEVKIDALLRFHDKGGESFIHDLDRKFLRHGGHAKPQGHGDGAAS